MADDYRLMNWASPTTPSPLRLLTAQPSPLPELPAPLPAPVAPAPAIAPDTLTLTPAAPSPLGPDAWTLPDLGLPLTPTAPAPAPAPVAPAPKAEPRPQPQPKPKAKPKPKPAPKPEPPKVDRSAQYAKKLRSHLHGKYYKTPTGCFRYAWNLAALSGGRSIGGASQSREARGRSTAYLGQLVKDGRMKVGDIVYINKKPGADPTSTILSYKPHWFIYLGDGKFADQYGERDAAAMDRMFYGRKIDTIYHTA